MSSDKTSERANVTVGGIEQDYNAVYQELNGDNVELSPYAEGVWNRSKRKFKENPFVPIGLGLCTVAVFNMFTTLKARDSGGFQKAQRFRVASQLATTVALIAGMQWSRYKLSNATDPEGLSAVEAKDQ